MTPLWCVGCEVRYNLEGIQGKRERENDKKDGIFCISKVYCCVLHDILCEDNAGAVTVPVYGVVRSRRGEEHSFVVRFATNHTAATERKAVYLSSVPTEPIASEPSHRPAEQLFVPGLSTWKGSKELLRCA